MIISMLSLIITLKNYLFLFYEVCFLDDNNFEKRLVFVLQSDASAIKDYISVTQQSNF